MTCPTCGKELKEGAVYCPNCGTKVLPLASIDNTTDALHVLSETDFAAEAEKKAEEARLAEERRRAEELKKEEEAKKAEELRKAEEVKKAEELKKEEEAKKAEAKKEKPARTILDPSEDEEDKPAVPKHRQNPNAKYIYFTSEENLVIPAAYRPTGGFGYFGYSLLFMIPVIGWIAAFVFSFNNHNISRRNFARCASIWIILCIAVITALVLMKAPVIQPAVQWVMSLLHIQA
ncbi:MAG: zinc ribbon domain-containing protein [Erysipelotrichales bacterium]|nr:zinc ribbon domain-containing protein [Erysipelotrichales bacterium]